MNSTELLAAFREEVQDEAVPYLWSDAAIFRYMDDAQRMFCRLTEGIEDARTPSVCSLAVTAGNEWLPISPLILKIRNAFDEEGRGIQVIASERISHHGVRFDGRPGRVHCLVSGFERNTLRAWYVPSEDGVIQLSVFRLPLETINGPDQELEIDAQHHEHLLLWMKHRAYDKQDAETFDRRKSEEFETKFRTYCVQAKREQVRGRHPVNMIAYGGL